MIKSEGTLRIKKIRQSRNGAFCIADLSTDFGEFKVKDPLLDQFEEGEYQGTVWISEIYLSQYIAYGKAVTEMRARLHDIQITSEDRKTVRPQETAEPDPIDEVSTPQVPTPTVANWASVKSNKIKPATKPVSQASEEQGTLLEKDATTPQGEEGIASLFSDEVNQLIETRQIIKLDPTVDRALFRQQTSALRELGYMFNAKTQDWHSRN